MINPELNRAIQQFQALNWRSTSQDRKIVLEGVDRLCQNLAQLSFQERSSCYSALTVVEQHEYRHLFIWVRLFEWIRSKFNSNFCTKSQLLSKVRGEKKRCETLYLTNRHLPTADLKELQTLHDKNSVRTHLSTFGQCLITPAEKALSTAIKVKRLPEVKKICAKHTPQRLLNQEHRPENILQTALEVKNKEIFDFLLQAGAKIHTSDIYGNTLLHFLASGKGLQMDHRDIFWQVPFSNILTALRIKNENNDTPLTVALQNQNTQFLNRLFERTQYIENYKNELKKIIQEFQVDIFIASQKSPVTSLQLMTKFLEFGIDLSSRGNISLLRSIQNKDVSLTTSFIKAKKDCQVKNEMDETALHIMAADRFWNQYPDLITNLIESGAPINAIDHQKRTPLIVAAQSDNMNVLHALLKKDVNINAVDGSGCSALNYLIRNERKEAALEMLASMNEGVIKDTLSCSDQEILSSWLKVSSTISLRLELKLIKTYFWMWSANLDIISKVSPRDQFSSEHVNEIIRIADINNDTFFHFVIRNDSVEWLKLFSTTQLLELLKRTNNADQIPITSLEYDSRCFKYLREKSKESVEFRDFLFSSLRIEQLSQAIQTGNIDLLKECRDISPVVFRNWMLSPLIVGFRNYDNPLIYALTVRDFECVKEMLYFYHKDLGDIFTNPGYSREFGQVFGNDLIIYQIGQVVINSCIEMYMQGATSWFDKLKWLEARSLFGNLLPYFEIPLPVNKEDFILALKRNSSQVKRLLTKKIEYIEHADDGFRYNFKKVTNPQTVLDIALERKIPFIFQVLIEQESLFLDEVLTSPEYMMGIVQKQDIDAIQCVSKASLISVLKDGFKNYNYLKEIIANWPEDKMKTFFEYLRPTSTSTPAYKINLVKLFYSVDGHKCNLLHLAVKANKPYLIKFIKNLDVGLFNQLLNAKDSTLASPLRLLINNLNSRFTTQLKMLNLMLEDYPNMVEKIFNLNKIKWGYLTEYEKKKIITRDLLDYLITGIRLAPAIKFPIHLLYFANSLGVDEKELINQISFRYISDFLNNYVELATLYANYANTIKTLLAHKDERGHNFLYKLAFYSDPRIPKIIDILAKLDLDFLIQMIKDRDNANCTLLHHISKGEVITHLYKHVPNVIIECLLVKNTFGDTPLMFAERMRKEELIVAIQTIQVSNIIVQVQDLQELAGCSPQKIVVETNLVALIKQKRSLESQIIYLRQQIRIKQIELRVKDLKVPFLIPTKEEVLQYKENVSHRGKATGCAKIPLADPKIDIRKLKIYFEQVYNKLPETAQISDDENLKTKLTVKEQFNKYIDIFNRDNPEVSGKILSTDSKDIINNIFRHLVILFMRQEEEINKAKKEKIKTNGEIKAMEDAFESNIKYILIYHLGVGFFHCIDRIASECEDMYFERVIGNAINLDGKTLQDRLYNALLIYRREIFRRIIDDIKTDAGTPDVHNAATQRYYQKTLGDELELGDTKLSKAAENYEGHAIKGRDAEIKAEFKKQYAPQELILHVKSLFDTSKLPSEVLSQWFEKSYMLREVDEAALLLADGTWNPQAIALFLADPSIGILSAS